MSDESKEKDALHRLMTLAQEPHPGLVTWRAAVRRAVDDAGITADAVVAEERAGCKAIAIACASGPAPHATPTGMALHIANEIGKRGTVPR